MPVATRKVPAPTRKIGDHEVSKIAFGLMSLSSHIYNGPTQTDEERFEVLDAVYAAGSTFWDTANVYGDNEDLLAKWFKRTGKRDEIFLSTKFGFGHGQHERLICGEPRYVAKALNASLARLGVDRVDLWYLHRADPTVPIELTIGAMAEQVKAGKVRYIGLSEVSAQTLRRAHAVHPIAAVQVEFSPFVLDIEDPKIGLLAAARELGVAIVAYSPLGRGLLTGRYKGPEDCAAEDYLRNVPRFSRENFSRILDVVETLKRVGSKYGVSPGRVALAWVTAQGEDFIPLFGSSKIANVKDNLGALELTLSAEDVQEVRRVTEEADKAMTGARYPDFLMSVMFVDTPPLK